MDPTKLNGKKVVDSQGYIVGEVNGIDVDLNTWQAMCMHVILSDDATVQLGFKKPFLSRILIAMPTRIIKAIGEVITISEPLSNLKDIIEKVED